MKSSATIRKSGDPAGQRAVILRILPKLLEEDIGFRARVAGLLAENLTSREETNRLYEEIRLLREETAGRFEAMDRRFEAIQTEMDRRFEAVDKRFESLQGEMDRRFEAVDRRFEAVDRRFEAVDRRFEAVIAELKDIKINLRDQHASIKTINKNLKDQRDWMETIVGGLQQRAGRNLEDMAAGALRFALGMEEIKPEAIKLRQKLTDTDGVIGPKGRTYEFDIVATDGEAYIFEVKSQADEEDVLRFHDKAELAIKKLGLAGVKKVILTLDKRPEVKETCQRYGIALP